MNEWHYLGEYWDFDNVISKMELQSGIFLVQPCHRSPAKWPPKIRSSSANFAAMDGDQPNAAALPKTEPNPLLYEPALHGRHAVLAKRLAQLAHADGAQDPDLPHRVPDLCEWRHVLDERGLKVPNPPPPGRSEEEAGRRQRRRAHWGLSMCRHLGGLVVDTPG
ncbi:hypothetical protein THAOC_35411 [Thalassiosira oceanica]|uniref:Uncharacterized protein n=1 Tax=Thalassiosira oceanica TaxID=159749 RepID=K0R1T7_THAOC|nr:hypothetical protein THAOC_35411 [Thalassiosira oceanica]|eukprot:EJK45950.1 hypothetical protein THAOC_35411 [Thalassiosira oceanica]